MQSLKNISCCTAFSAAYCSWNWSVCFYKFKANGDRWVCFCSFLVLLLIKNFFGYFLVFSSFMRWIHEIFALNILVRKLAQDCCKYGDDNQSTNYPLARAALHFGTSHSSMEEERETLLGVLLDQVISSLISFMLEILSYFYQTVNPSRELKFLYLFLWWDYMPE